MSAIISSFIAALQDGKIYAPDEHLSILRTAERDNSRYRSFCVPDTILEKIAHAPKSAEYADLIANLASPHYTVAVKYLLQESALTLEDKKLLWEEFHAKSPAAFTRRGMDRLESHFSLSEHLGHARTVLDLGCGKDGTAVRELSACGYDAYGIDLMISRGPSSIVRGDAVALPFRSDTFDAVYSCAVLDYFNNNELQQTAAEVYRVLRPGGRFISDEKRLKEHHLFSAYARGEQMWTVSLLVK